MLVFRIMGVVQILMLIRPSRSPNGFFYCRRRILNRKSRSSPVDVFNISNQNIKTMFSNFALRVQKLQFLLDLEPVITIAALFSLSWLFYKLFLREVSQDRHKSLQNHFQKILRHFVVLVALLVISLIFIHNFSDNDHLKRPIPYLTLLTVFWGAMLFVRVSRLLILQYLFLGSMTAGVPLLIVNIFSLLMSVVFSLWMASFVFEVDLGPLLATSAAFSIILGLALQDTLGNLFAGISLQLDKSFEIGDWLEIVNGIQKTVGQVHEITWRSTTLLGWSDELVVLPNRFVANSQISNFHNGNLTFVRSQVFRLSYDVDQEKVKKILVKTIEEISGVKNKPEPLCFVSETADSWLMFKLTYAIDRYGAQFLIGDLVQTKSLENLKKAGIETVCQTYKIQPLKILKEETNSEV